MTHISCLFGYEEKKHHFRHSRAKSGRKVLGFTGKRAPSVVLRSLIIKITASNDRKPLQKKSGSARISTPLGGGVTGVCTQIEMQYLTHVCLYPEKKNKKKKTGTTCQKLN